MLLFIALVVAVGVAYRVTTAEERERFLHAVLLEARQARDAAVRSRVKCEPYRAALRERMQWALVTPALAALIVVVFLGLRFGAPASEADALLGWGANLGTRTTNGEWWRLLTAMFVHDSALAVVINVVALVQLGLILERLVGRSVFTLVFVGAGVFAALRSISIHPVLVTAGASGAIFGLLGLLVATICWDVRRRTSVSLPPLAMARLAPPLIVFILYNLAAGRLEAASDFAAFVVGLVAGLILTQQVRDELPARQPVMIAVGVTAVLAAICAIPLRHIADVKPEIAHVVAVEGQTSQAYQVAADSLKRGKMTAESLAQLIDRTIVPELQAADARIKALERVPAEHQPLVDGAEEYLRLRCESWRLRAEGLRKTSAFSKSNAGRTAQTSDQTWRTRAESQYRSNLITLGKAEGTERRSLEALERIKPAAGQ